MLDLYDENGVQKAISVKEKEPEVRKFYETCGVFLGFSLAQNIEF